MRTFDQDDEGYLAWLDTHQRGYVVNSFRRPTPNYLKLHQATCKSISRTAPEPIRWTTGDFVKTCSTNLSELERWAQEVAGGVLSPHKQCDPA